MGALAAYLRVQTTAGSANRGVTGRDRPLWGLSPGLAYLVLVGCLASLVYVVRGEFVASPKARGRMDALRTELAST
jgi:hypothetical protein